MSAVPDPTSSDGLFGSLKDIFGGINDLTGNNLGNLAAGAAGIDAAAQQKKENTALVQPLKDVATPFINSGLSQLNDYSQLTPLQQQALQSGVTTGQTLSGESAPLLQIGNNAFDQYTQGKLPAWQQAQLDQKVANAKALNRQALGGNVDSSSLGATEGQIDLQGMISQGQLLQANLATGQSAYKQGTDLQAQGGTMQTTAYNKAVSDVNQNLQNAINTTLTGLGPLTTSIQTEIAGNTALTGQLQALFAAIAKSMSSAASGTGTAASGAGSISKGLSGVGSALKNLFGTDTTGIGTAANAAMNGTLDSLSNLPIGAIDTPLTNGLMSSAVPDGAVDVGEITDLGSGGLPSAAASGAGAPIASSVADAVGGGLLPTGIDLAANPGMDSFASYLTSLQDSASAAVDASAPTALAGPGLAALVAAMTVGGPLAIGQMANKEQDLLPTPVLINDPRYEGTPQQYRWTQSASDYQTTLNDIQKWHVQQGHITTVSDRLGDLSAPGAAEEYQNLLRSVLGPNYDGGYGY